MSDITGQIVPLRGFPSDLSGDDDIQETHRKEYSIKEISSEPATLTGLPLVQTP